jgi:hypothetical protein
MLKTQIKTYEFGYKFANFKENIGFNQSEPATTLEIQEGKIKSS